MRLLPRAFAYLLLIATPTLAADWEGVFEGTLGKSKIIVELNAGAEASDYKGGYSDGSRYSYLPNAFDLKLALESENGMLEFAESTSPHYAIVDLPKDDPARSGHWTLDVTGNSATGTWRSTDGKKQLPIKLQRLALVAEQDVPKDFNQLSVTYNARWFSEVKISGATKPARFGDVTLAHEKDSAFNLEMPVFTNSPDQAAMLRGNTMLREYYRSSLMSYRDCINGLPQEPAKPFEPEYVFEVTYASPQVVTLQESGSVFCGGAHPSNYVSYLTYDLLMGQQIGGRYQLDLSPQGFGTLLKLASKPERIAFENFAIGRWMEAAKAAGEAGDDGCAGPSFMGDDQPGEKNFSLAFAKSGLAVQRTDYPHVASNCLFQDYNPTIIPWAEMKPWLRSDQKLLTQELQ